MLILIIIAGFWAFYHWWKKDRYTREKFAFSGFFALLGLGSFFGGNIYLNMSLLSSVSTVLLKPFGGAVQPSSPASIEIIAFTCIYIGLCYSFIQIFKHWGGIKSLAQHEQEQCRKKASLLRDIGLIFNPIQEQRKKLKPYHEEDVQLQPVTEKPETLVWHVRAKQLLGLRNRSYMFEEEYNQGLNSWVGVEKNTGELVILTCHHNNPGEEFMGELTSYAKKILEKRQCRNFEVILAIKNGDKSNRESNSEYTIKYTNETELLTGLVDFSDYFSDIQYRVEQAILIDSNISIKSTYTPSFFSKKEKGEIEKDNVGEFIERWLGDTNQKQLAILGDYGQGKSTSSLMLTYNLISQEHENNQGYRIPILIELRGHPLRSMTKEGLLAIWASRYGIDPRALLHLHMSGKLLMIFEGFDEIDLSGDTEARMSHFRSIWALNFEKSKIIVTGRRNFFRNKIEFNRALGDETQTQILYLAPFNMSQIRDSLRVVEPCVRDEISELAEKDDKFREVVSRPSLLYIVSVLWLRENLSQYSNISSAQVMDIFIRKTLKRQQDKHDERPFMVLNSAERHYFMMGVATYMASEYLPNQIYMHELEKVVVTLIDSIPDYVSKSVNTIKNEDSLPLRSNDRLDWQQSRESIIQKIQTDVRSCGLLVTDLSKDGAFKFSHKSFMEHSVCRCLLIKQKVLLGSPS